MSVQSTVIGSGGRIGPAPPYLYSDPIITRSANADGVLPFHIVVGFTLSPRFRQLMGYRTNSQAALYAPHAGLSIYILHFSHPRIYTRPTGLHYSTCSSVRGKGKGKRQGKGKEKDKDREERDQANVRERERKRETERERKKEREKERKREREREKEKGKGKER